MIRDVTGTGDGRNDSLMTKETMMPRTDPGRDAPLLAVLVAAGLAGAAPAAARAPMDRSEIERTIAGKRIYLRTPFGGEVPLHDRRDGRVDGTGQAVGLGRFMQPDDKGRWWLRGDRLCQQWESWYDGRPFCFTLSRGKGDQLFWTRDDGLSGRARIGRRERSPGSSARGGNL